jgi:hypothetical protein
MLELDPRFGDRGSIESSVGHLMSFQKQRDRWRAPTEQWLSAKKRPRNQIPADWPSDRVEETKAQGETPIRLVWITLKAL